MHDFLLYEELVEAQDPRQRRFPQMHCRRSLEVTVQNQLSEVIRHFGMQPHQCSESPLGSIHSSTLYSCGRYALLQPGLPPAPAHRLTLYNQQMLLLQDKLRSAAS